MSPQIGKAALLPVAVFALSAGLAARQTPRPTCLMQAPPAVFAMPPQGFIDGDEPDRMRACDAVSGEWLRGSLGSGDRVDAKTGRLLLDVPLSGRMAEEVASAYRAPLTDAQTAGAPTLADERRMAAAALDAFAADRCRLPQENRR